MTRISRIKPRLLIARWSCLQASIWNGAFKMDGSGRSLVWAKCLHVASVDKQTPSRVHEGIVDITGNNENFYGW